jgi:uncharacterized glyoxalase superfamily protein PhnB
MAAEAPTLYPTLRYADAPAAIDFLEKAFGFRRIQVIENPDGTIAHAELAFGPSVLMLGSDRDDVLRGRKAGQGWMYVAVDDADRSCEQARAGGADIVDGPYATEYGSRDFTARDPEGNVWSFGTYRPGCEHAGAAAATSAAASAMADHNPGG